LPCSSPWRSPCPPVPSMGMSALLKVTVGGKEIARLRYVLK
jgi:hypothetical protein